MLNHLKLLSHVTARSPRLSCRAHRQALPSSRTRRLANRRTRSSELTALLGLCLLGCTQPTEHSAPDPEPPPAVAVSENALTSGCTSACNAGRDYLFCTTNKSWSAAQTDCRARGMELLRLESQTESDFVRTRMQAESWIGGTDAASEGKWLWSNNGTQFWNGTYTGSAVGGLYTNWDSQQPDNLNGTEHCLTKRIVGASRWDDRTCTTQLDYVCERMNDLCPDDPNKVSPGVCGCGIADQDVNLDGTIDCGGCTPVTQAGRDYLFCTTDSTWSAAQNSCRSMGMELVRIDNATEDDFVKTKTRAESWIDATDVTTEGKWVWSSSGTQFWSGKANGTKVSGLYSNWASNQPDDYNATQDCASKRVGSDPRWDDRTCSTLLDYVCERMVDLCPADPNKTSAGACGCGSPDIDLNGDGVADCGGCIRAQYGTHDYLFCTKESSWTAARSDCRARGADLVRVDDAAENTFLKATMRAESWIGASDATTEGKWLWVNNNAQFWSGKASGSATNGAYTRWAYGQPDDLNSAQDCASIRYTSDPQWDDRSCTSTLLDYICEELDGCQPTATSDTTCNGVDDDCDGNVDDDYVQQPLSCGTGACARSGLTQCVSGVVQQTCNPGAPATGDATCNAIDDDCDGRVDESYAAQTTHCGVGACTATGTTQCTAGQSADSCNPGTPSAHDASCDGRDDDCDGRVDENYAPAQTTCGVGSCSANGTRTCINGAVVDSCSQGTGSASDAVCNGVDDDCNGRVDEDYVAQPAQCGVGACAATGTTACVDGAAQNSCTPGPPATNDATCNGIDDDCDGLIDEDYAALTVTCGVGACAATGTLSCVNGATINSCTPRAAAPSDTTCDGIDDNCNGVADEGFTPVATHCGIGTCMRAGTTRCVQGQVHDDCTAVAPAASDTTCDQADDDCDGEVDENCETACSNDNDDDEDGATDCDDSDCAPLGSCKVGRACTTDELCRDLLGPQATCLDEIPGGYCITACTETADCPSGTFCYQNRICVLSCEQDGTCPNRVCH